MTKTKEEKREYNRAYHAAHRAERRARDAINREKHRVDQVKYRADNPEKARATCAAWRAQNPDNVRSLKLKQYGITAAQYDAMLTAQDGACASCGRPPTAKRRMHVDHNHDTGQVRAILCNGCNTSFGHLQEDPALILALHAYAVKWSQI